MKNLSNYVNSEKGLTLIEILASITILFILLMSFLSMFVQSSRTNNYSKNIMDATYVAESTMEKINYNVTTMDPKELTTLVTPQAFLSKFILLPPEMYTKKCTDGTCYETKTDINGPYVYVEFVPKDLLISVKVKVFNNKSSSKKLEAEMEMLVSWKK